MYRPVIVSSKTFLLVLGVILLTRIIAITEITHAHNEKCMGSFAHLKYDTAPNTSDAIRPSAIAARAPCRVAPRQ